jgi:signal transduction histidine kinase
LTADRLTDWGLGEDVGFAASLVVSELVTNAVIHTGSARVLLELVDTEGRLRIAVRDEGIGPEGPRLRRTAQDAGEHGRGLVLVDGMCDAWGSQENGPESGRTVWAELPHGCGDLTADLTADLAADLTADSLLGSDDLVSAPPAVQGGALR